MATTDMSANINFSTVDGMGFEEVNQQVTGTVIVSGMNIYASDTVYAAAGSITNIGGVTTASGGTAAFNTYQGEVAWVTTGSITNLHVIGSVGFYDTLVKAQPQVEVNIGSLHASLVDIGLIGSIA